VRLNKRLVELGLSVSRRKADEAIEQNLVTVNGEIASLGMSVGNTDKIRLNGKGGETKTPIYVALNKPTGYICSHAEQGNSKTIFTLLPKSFAHLKIAGRLDKESEGLVILSSDGEFVNTVTHPSSQKEKEYLLVIDKPVKTEDIAKLREGVRLYDGISKFISISKINATTLRVVISEGRNRQIRRTFEQLNYQVIKLQRTRMSKFELKTLPPGKHQIIKPGDVL
jgi:pseudouridine synthase